MLGDDSFWASVLKETRKIKDFGVKCRVVFGSQDGYHRFDALSLPAVHPPVGGG